MLESPFTAGEISNGIEQLMNNKASSYDSISNGILKFDASITLPFLTIMLNKILETKE